MATETVGLSYPRHVTEEVDLLAKSLGFASRVYLFVDYDGTLVSGPRRSGPRPADVMVRRLEQLADVACFSVFIVSGRPLGEIRSLVDVEGIGYIGQGGFEIEWPHHSTMRAVPEDDAVSTVHHVELEAHRHLAGCQGVELENRGYGLILHMDGAPPAISKHASEAFMNAVRRIDTASSMEIHLGNGVMEARLSGWNKGDAIMRVLDEADADDSLAIYIGDDMTDEPAFEAVSLWSEDREGGSPWQLADEEDDEGSGALTILVSPAPRLTSATLFVRDTTEVHEFLSSLSTIACTLL